MDSFYTFKNFLAWINSHTSNITHLTLITFLSWQSNDLTRLIFNKARDLTSIYKKLSLFQFSCHNFAFFIISNLPHLAESFLPTSARDRHSNSALSVRCPQFHLEQRNHRNKCTHIPPQLCPECYYINDELCSSTFIGNSIHILDCLCHCNCSNVK